MTIIFDENVPWPLSRHLASYKVSSVQKEGWAGMQNGALIQAIDGLFDILLLADKNLRYQQNLAERRIAIIELPTNRWPALQEKLTAIQAAIENAQPGSYQMID
jgi:hypothetical protein